MSHPSDPISLSHLTTEEVERLLGGRLLADPFLAAMLEELCVRQIKKEHAILESCSTENVKEAQGIIRGTRYFLDLRVTEMMRREALDPASSEA